MITRNYVSKFVRCWSCWHMKYVFKSLGMCGECQFNWFITVQVGFDLDTSECIRVYLEYMSLVVSTRDWPVRIRQPPSVRVWATKPSTTWTSARPRWTRAAPYCPPTDCPDMSRETWSKCSATATSKCQQCTVRSRVRDWRHARFESHRDNRLQYMTREGLTCTRIQSHSELDQCQFQTWSHSFGTFRPGSECIPDKCVCNVCTTPPKTSTTGATAKHLSAANTVGSVSSKCLMMREKYSMRASSK